MTRVRNITLRDDFGDFFSRNIFALSFKSFNQVFLRDETRVVSVEEVEGKQKIALREGLFLIDYRGEEFGVVDGAVLVVVDFVDELADVLLGFDEAVLLEGGDDFVDGERA